MKKKALFYLLINFHLLACHKKPYNPETTVPGFEKLEISKSEGFTQLKTNPNNSVTIKVDLKSLKNRIVPLTDLADSTAFIKVETANNNLLGDYSEIVPYKDGFLIADSDNSNKVIHINESGYLVSNIGRQGIGPGEFYDPTNLTTKGDTIIIYSELEAKLIYYHSDGTFLFQRGVPFVASDFIYLNNRFFWETFNNPNGHSITVADASILKTNLDLEFENTALKYDYNITDKSGHGFKNRIKTFRNFIYYSPHFSNRIYEWNSMDNTFNEIYNIDFNQNFKDLEKIIPDLKDYKITDYMFSNKLCYIQDYFLTDRFLLLMVNFDFKLFSILIDRNTNEVKGGIALLDDINRLGSVKPFLLSEHKLLSVIEPFDLKNSIQRTDENKIKELINKHPSLNNLTEFENKIIRIDYLKY